MRVGCCGEAAPDRLGQSWKTRSRSATETESHESTWRSQAPAVPQLERGRQAFRRSPDEMKIRDETHVAGRRTSVSRRSVVESGRPLRVETRGTAHAVCVDILHRMSSLLSAKHRTHDHVASTSECDAPRMVASATELLPGDHTASVPWDRRARRDWARSLLSAALFTVGIAVVGRLLARVGIRPILEDVKLAGPGVTLVFAGAARRTAPSTCSVGCCCCRGGPARASRGPTVCSWRHRRAMNSASECWASLLKVLALQKQDEDVATAAVILDNATCFTALSVAFSSRSASGLGSFARGRPCCPRRSWRRPSSGPCCCCAGAARVTAG